MPIQNFTDLETWKHAHVVVLEIYKITKKFPQYERFGLVNQLERAGVSITSNIAEGFGRNSAKDKSQFYAIAKGSVLEVQNQLIIARDLKYISQSDFDFIYSQTIQVVKLISGLARSAFDR